MTSYHKIQTVYKRDSATKHKTLLQWEFSLPEFEYLRENQWVFTEKVDGTNVRIMWDGVVIKFGGKTDNAQMPMPLMTALSDLFKPKVALMEQIFEAPGSIPTGETFGVCLYGEGYGGKIQSGGKYRPDQNFVLFDIKVGHWWLQRKDIEDIATKLGIDIVPIIGRGDLQDMVDMAEKGFNSQWGDFIAEGIVARPETEMRTRNGKRLITKIKYKDFGKDK